MCVQNSSRITQRHRERLDRKSFRLMELFPSGQGEHFTWHFTKTTFTSLSNTHIRTRAYTVCSMQLGVCSHHLLSCSRAPGPTTGGDGWLEGYRPFRWDGHYFLLHSSPPPPLEQAASAVRSVVRCSVVSGAQRNPLQLYPRAAPGWFVLFVCASWSGGDGAMLACLDASFPHGHSAHRWGGSVCTGGGLLWGGKR